jgi:hypothetical protein
MAHLHLVWDFMRSHLIDIFVDGGCLGGIVDA